MNLRHLATCGLIGALALVGCDSGRQAPPRVTVRVANAAPGFNEVVFIRERDENNSSSLAFKTAQEFSYDADTYDFYTRVLASSGEIEEGTFSATLAGDSGYYFVMTEVAGEVVPVVLQYGPAPSADTQILGLNAGENLPAMDLYLERPGVGIAGATPRGTLAARGQFSARSIPSGDYELWLTPAGDPSTVLLHSTSLTLDAGRTTAFVVAPEAGETTVPLNVQGVQDISVVFREITAEAEIRVINAATDRQARDFAINREFAPPLFSAIPFGPPTNYATVPVNDTLPINVTPPGNPGVLELDQTIATVSTVRYTIVVTGDAGTLTHVVAADDNRRIHGAAKVRFFNFAAQFTDLIEFVFVPPGEPHGQFVAEAATITPSVTAYSLLAANDYDLYLRLFSTGEAIAGPIPVTLTGDGIYSVLAVNGPNNTTADVVLFDDFP
jgi:hypothetical protein